MAPKPVIIEMDIVFSKPMFMPGENVEGTVTLTTNKVTVDCSDLGIDGGHNRPKRKGIRCAKCFCVVCGRNVESARMLVVSLVRVGKVERCSVSQGTRGQWSND